MRTAKPIDRDVFLELGVRFDADAGRPTPMAERYEQSACSDPRCPYQFSFVFPHESPSAALEAATTHVQTAGVTARYLVQLRLAQANRVYATKIPFLCEDAVRDGDEDAFEALRVMRDAGADLVVIRAGDGEDDSDTITILFTGSFGDTVDVVEEAMAFHENGRWHHLPTEWTDGPTRPSVRPLTAWPQATLGRWSSTRKVAFVVWEATVAYLVSKYADPVLEFAGTSAEAPFVPVIVLALLLGWLVGAKLLLLRDCVWMWTARTFGPHVALPGSVASLRIEVAYLRQEVAATHRLLASRGATPSGD